MPKHLSADKVLSKKLQSGRQFCLRFKWRVLGGFLESSRHVHGRFRRRSWNKNLRDFAVAFDEALRVCGVTIAFAYILLKWPCAGRCPGYVDRGAEKVHNVRAMPRTLSCIPYYLAHGHLQGDAQAIWTEAQRRCAMSGRCPGL